MPSLDSSSCPKLVPAVYGEAAYPRSMFVERKEGWVVLEFDVLPNDWIPQNVHIFASSHPGGAFEVEVLRAFARTRYNVPSAYQGCRMGYVFNLAE